MNRFGGNALIPAAEKGHLETVKLLLADGHVTINHQNNYGYTALIEAVTLRDGSKVYQDIVSELLKYGANPDITDNYGKSAKDYANELGYGTISKLLKDRRKCQRRTNKSSPFKIFILVIGSRMKCNKPLTNIFKPIFRTLETTSSKLSQHIQFCISLYKYDSYYGIIS